MTSDLRDQLEHGLAGSYTVERELGGGGMSRVFVADDLALGRKVVVKVLRTDITEALSAERFRREIQLAARLQHSHIVPLLTAGALDNAALFYTMPLVDGESLRDRLNREDGGLPIIECTRVMRDVASALAYAHAHQVVHRDIKPENVLLSHGGAVVTDFGIAKAIHAARAEASTDGQRSSTLTAAGTSLGTPAYMAPEQAVGDVIDHRADLYALGVVTYEMLAGRPPFAGRSAHQLLAAHASTAPEPVTRLRRNAPPELVALVMQLLEKNPADRPQSASEILQRLDGAVTAPLPRARRLSDPLIFVLGGMLAAAIGVLAWSFRSHDDVRPTRARVALDLPADAKVNPGSGFGNSMAFSPDGETLVYVGGPSPGRLYQRRLDELTPHPVAGTEGALNPQFSPDGREIGFVANLTLRAVPTTGGTARVIAQGVGRFAWGPNETIVFSRPSVLSPRGSLWRVGARGGAPAELTHSDTTLRRFHGSPTFLPDGHSVLFSSRQSSGDPTLMLVRLDDDKITPLNIAGGSPVYFRNHILFARSDGTIAAVRFDSKSSRVIGEPVTVVENVVLKAGGAAELAVSSTGTLAYLTGTVGQQLVDVDRHGTTTTVIARIDNYREPRVSPDGRHIALTMGRPPYFSDIWIYDITSTTLNRLTTGGTNTNATWSPDGRHVAWTSIGQPNGGASKSAGGVWWQPWDASAPPTLLVPDAEGARFTLSGDSILTSFDVDGANELRLVPLPYQARRAPVPLLPPQPQPRQARLSPDGHWLAYVSDETGAREVYIQSFPAPGGHFPISSGGGSEPVWGRASNTVTYRSGSKVMEATIALTPAVTVLRRDTLFSADAALSVVEAMYDVSPNGHFVMVKTVASGAPPVLVFGWSEELHEKMEAARKR